MIEDVGDVVAVLDPFDQKVTIQRGSDMDWRFWRVKAEVLLQATADSDFFPSAVLPACDLGWILYAQPAENHSRIFVELGATGDLQHG